MATEQTVLSYGLNLDRAANLAFLVGGKHTYSNTSGSKPWQLAIYLDDALLNYAGGSGYGEDAPNLEASAQGVPAGSHTVRVTWYGHSSMQLRGVNLIVQGAKK